MHMDNEYKQEVHFLQAVVDLIIYFGREKIMIDWCSLATAVLDMGIRTVN